MPGGSRVVSNQSNESVAFVSCLGSVGTGGCVSGHLGPMNCELRASGTGP